MRRGGDTVYVLSGIVFVCLFFIGLLVLARFVPPPSPNDSAQQVVEMYLSRTNSIRSGLLLCFLGTIFMLAFGTGLSGQIRRIRGLSPSVVHLQVASVACSVLIIMLPIVCWWVAAFRADVRSPEITQLVNDLGWMTFVVSFPPFITWCASTGQAILSDTSDRPLFPRWAGYLSFFVAVAQIPPGLLVFFKTGPFAWNGLISYWIPLFDFFPWVVVMIVLAFRATRRDDYEVDPLDAVGAPVRHPAQP